MRIKEIVCDYEYAKKLRDLGLKNSTIFDITDSGRVGICLMGIPCINTYTVAELGEILSEKIISDKTEFEISICFGNEEWYASYEETHLCEVISYLNSCRDKKEANARAKLLIWLIENRYLDV